MPEYAIAILALALGGLAWFLIQVRRQVRHFRPAAQPLINRARGQKSMKDLEGRSVDELFVSARAGNPAAQHRLGILYAEGRGLPQDEKKAASWFERAASSDFVDAQYYLGLNYEHGRGVKRDYAKARFWYEKAARGGDARAQCNLGVLYLTGRGVPVSTVNAAYWLVNSAAQGNEQAIANLEWLSKHHCEFSADDDITLRHSRDRAHRGDADALVLLGWISQVGLGIPENKHEARLYYERAQSNGYLFAHNLLSRL